eukprot:COSAG02_NODE_7529_length_2972_cov_2.393665_1_plen_115_part_00
MPGARHRLPSDMRSSFESLGMKPPIELYSSPKWSSINLKQWLVSCSSGNGAVSCDTYDVLAQQLGESAPHRTSGAVATDDKSGMLSCETQYGFLGGSRARLRYQVGSVYYDALR